MSDFAATIELSALDGSNGFKLSGVAAADYSGYSVASAGDVNGDGYDDLIIGAKKADPNGTDSGATYVVFGHAGGLGAGGFSANFNLSTLNGTNGFKLSGVAANDTSGVSVASAGDVNHDGFDDLIIGAQGADTNATDAGATYVVFGHASGFAANLNLSTLNGTTGFRLSGVAASDLVGISVSSAGDVNGDGYVDVIVGAFRADANGTDSGAAYVVFGKASGFTSNVNLSTLNGTTGFKLSGVATTDLAGYVVASAGDMNHDGYDDVIISAPFADPNGADSGAAYVVFGKASGFASNLNLSTLNGTTGFKLSGVAAGDHFGNWVATAGDVNGDGFEDIIVGANYADPNSISNCGASYVVFGKASGFSANLNVSTLDGTNGFRISGVTAGDQSGYNIASAGDVNGDGYGDLIIGARGAAPNGASSGASYVVFGNSSGFGAELKLSTLNGANGFKINGVAAGDLSGFSVAAAGDINGDGYSDLIVGAFRADPNGVDSGASYVIFGHATSVTYFGGATDDTRSGSADNDRLTGGAGKDTLYGMAGNDTLNGGTEGDWLDGGTGADAMTGGTGDDTFVIDDAGDTVIESSGEGNDVVHASITYTLGTNLERLILDGTGDIGGTGNGVDNIIMGNSGANSLDGADGDDVIKGGAGNDTVSGGNGVDLLYGGDGADTVSGGSGNDMLYGNDGADDLDGGAGRDTLDGGVGADTLAGGDGNDIIDGGTGADAMSGGLGDDTFYVDDVGDTVTEASAQGQDNVRSTAASFTLTANVENLILDGTGDISGTGSSGDNAITGNSGNNTLDGGAGDDLLKGGNGNDILIGGAGSDILVGGAGADTFVVTQASVRQSHLGGVLEVDVVNDLTKAQGDRIDLSAIDADSITAGDQAFHLVGNFSHHAAEMILSFSGGITLLSLDVDGDGSADYRMKITGDVHLDSGGWVL